MIWDKFIDLSEYAQIMMEGFLGRPTTVDRQNEYHTDIRYESSHVVSLGNISIIDMRESKKMWMMHMACYSNISFPMPVYGFDGVCGKSKVTGCFHDFSPTVDNVSSATCTSKFKEQTSRFVPKRNRELPQWAKEIFSENMVIAGATDDPYEIDALVHMGKENLFTWLNTVHQAPPCAESAEVLKYTEALSKYCTNQLANTNSKNVMIALGLEEDYVNQFKKRQFPY